VSVTIFGRPMKLYFIAGAVQFLFPFWPFVQSFFIVHDVLSLFCDDSLFFLDHNHAAVVTHTTLGGFGPDGLLA